MPDRGKDGTGQLSRHSQHLTPMAGHTATIPGNIERADSKKLDSALNFNTFGKIIDAGNIMNVLPFWHKRFDGSGTRSECRDWNSLRLA